MSRKSFRLPLAALLFTAFTAMCSQNQSFALVKDATNHVLTMSPSTSAATNTSELRSALSLLNSRADKSTPWTLKLNPGKYVMSAQASANGLQNVVITSADPANPAKLVKMSGWNSASSGEYLLFITMAKNIAMKGLEFYGQTSFAANANPYWPDQGVYFGSSDTVKVDGNKFYNFGNSALRVSTWERDPVTGVHSSNTTVTNNLFNNIYQTSTTVQDNIHGATSNYLMQGNTFVNLRGSVKFASRTPGATGVRVINNIINGGDHFGLEINNYNNFEIRGNTISNIKGVAVNIYTGVIPGFPWGDNFTIASNTLKNVARGIRYSHEPGSDGYQSIPKNLVIDSNTLSGVTDTSTGAPAISEVNGKVSGVKVTGNKLSSITNKKYITVTQGSTSVSILNNIVDGAAYGPQSTTASK
jgi:hypothetical protein